MRQGIPQVWLKLRQGAKSSPKPPLMDWWRLYSALLKYLLAFECCSQETQQRRTAGERQLGKDAALHQIFGYPMSQVTWPEAICCGHWGHGQPGSVDTTWLFCYIPFPFSVTGRLLEHLGCWDLQHPNKVMVHTWYHLKKKFWLYRIDTGPGI